jgi:hypothetical protein
MTYKHLNIPFCEEVLAFAVKEPRGFVHDQNVFLDIDEDLAIEEWENAPIVEGYVKIKCGTKACIAGIAALIHPNVTIGGLDVEPRYKGRESNYQSIGRRLMGLTEAQSDRLFLDTCSEENAAQAAINLLKHFIEEAKIERGVNA